MSAPRVDALLFQLGITENYAGFPFTEYALHLLLDEPAYLRSLTNRLYPDIAAQHHTTWKNVERNIRTVIDIAWRSNRELLVCMAPFPLTQKPKTSQFLAILLHYFQMKDRPQ